MDIKLVTYNCRGAKSSIDAIRELCESHDVVLIQEHWLNKVELSILSKIHNDFNACGVSAMDDEIGIRVGRPYGGVAIMWRKSLGNKVNVKYLDDTRLIGLEVCTDETNLFIICAYLPTCKHENYDDYLNYLAKINCIIQDCNTVNAIVLGDFNSNVGTIFGDELEKFCTENNLHISDIDILGKCDKNFTFYSEAHASTR